VSFGDFDSFSISSRVAYIAILAIAM